MTYTSLEQRMAQTYMELYPQFVPDEYAPVSEEEQKEFYLFVKSLYQLAFDEPQIFVPALHEDDAYPNHFNKASYGKPDLQKEMHRFLKVVDTLLQNMFLLGQGREVKLPKKHQAILKRLGIYDYKTLPAGWVWMARRENAGLTAFSHCFFKADYPYTMEIFSALFKSSAYQNLVSWMTERGYQHFEYEQIITGHSNLSLTYANPAWSKEPPRSGFEYKIRHTGISVRYDALMQNPLILGLCIPNGMRPYLDAFSSMDEKLQSFVASRTKKCDGCRYCVQTDKTGTRPLACVTVEYAQKQYRFCPYFPGYRYCWNGVDDEIADQMIAFLDFMDQFCKK